MERVWLSRLEVERVGCLDSRLPGRAAWRESGTHDAAASLASCLHDEASGIDDPRGGTRHRQTCLQAVGFRVSGGESYSGVGKGEQRGCRVVLVAGWDLV